MAEQSKPKRTEGIRRAETKEFLQHLKTKQRLITDEEEAKEWAESVRSFIAEERANHGYSFVHKVSYYANKGKAMAGCFDAARSQIDRACKREGVVVRVGQGGKLRQSDYIHQYVPDEKGLVQEIVHILNQGRSNFVAQQATDLKLIEAGPGETSSKGQQQDQLIFLASYGRENPNYALSDFLAGHLVSFPPDKLMRWFEVQQQQIVPIQGCPDWKTFRRLCLDQRLGEWFRELYAHQWYLYRTGYFLDQLAYVANFTVNFQISPPRKDPNVDKLLDEVREVLYELHTNVANSRLLVSDRGEE